MIKGHCETTLNNYIMFVRVFYEIPKKGDKVAVKTEKQQITYLRVVSVILSEQDNEPYIIVELNKEVV